MQVQSSANATRHADGKILADVQGHVGVITFNNPDKHNAMSVDMWGGLAEALAAHAADARVRVVVLTGAGDKAFVAGADIGQLGQLRSGPDGAAQSGGEGGPSIWHLMDGCAKPTIACIRGYCIGGGLAIAAQADIRIAAEGSQFGIPAARLGLAYAFDGVRTLVGLVGHAWTRLLLYSAERIGAEEALRIGLVQRVVKPDALWGEVMALAERIAANAPLSVTAAKVTIDQAAHDGAAPDMAAVREAALRCAGSQDFQEGQRAFMEKRTPRFEGC